MKNFFITLLCMLNIETFAQNFTIQNNTQSVTILPNAIQTNRPELTGKGNLSIGKEALRLAGVGQMNILNSIAIGDSALSNASLKLLNNNFLIMKNEFTELKAMINSKLLLNNVR